MKASNANIELAESRVEAERDHGVRQVQQALRGMGRRICADCDEPIAAERLKALPSAGRCIRCQIIVENATRKCA